MQREGALLSNFHANEGDACACMHVCTSAVQFPIDKVQVNANYF